MISDTMLPVPNTTPFPGRLNPRRFLRILRSETATELLKSVRLPIFAISTIAFPVMFYVIFGATFGRQQAGPVDVATYMLATYGAYGVIGAALFSFGVGVAVERAQGWMRLKRASPMPGTVTVRGSVSATVGVATPAEAKRATGPPMLKSVTRTKARMATPMSLPLRDMLMLSASC